MRRFLISLTYILIIPHFVGFVKNFFYFLFLDSVRSTWKQSLAFLRIGIRVAFYISLFLYLTVLLYHTLWGLSRGFRDFFYFFSSLGVVSQLSTLPLTIIIISENFEKARWYFAQKRITKMNFFCAICQAPGRVRGG